MARLVFWMKVQRNALLWMLFLMSASLYSPLNFPGALTPRLQYIDSIWYYISVMVSNTIPSLFSDLYIYSEIISIIACRLVRAFPLWCANISLAALMISGGLPIHSLSIIFLHSARRALCGASSAIDPEALLSLSEACLTHFLQSIKNIIDGMQARLSIIV